MTPGSLMKAIIRPAHGAAKPTEGDQVIFHCTTRTLDGVTVDSTRSEHGGKGNPLRYVLGKSKMILGFSEGIPTMFKGEVAMEQLQDDSCRVDGLFQKALEAGISIQCRSISGQEISVLILSGQYIAIALVDKIKLRQSSSEDTCIPECFAGSSDYTGHYVVVCGYDVDTDEFEIRDPASLRKDERVSLECFDDARKSPGTDEDILVISLNGKDDDD